MQKWSYFLLKCCEVTLLNAVVPIHPHRVGDTVFLSVYPSTRWLSVIACSKVIFSRTFRWRNVGISTPQMCSLECSKSCCNQGKSVGGWGPYSRNPPFEREVPLCGVGEVAVQGWKEGSGVGNWQGRVWRGRGSIVITDHWLSGSWQPLIMYPSIMVFLH